MAGNIPSYPTEIIIVNADSLMDVSQLVSPGVYESSKIKFSVLNSLITGNNLGSSDLSSSDSVRTFKLNGNTDETFHFQNSDGATILTINGYGDVFSRGLSNVVGNTVLGNNTGRVISEQNNTLIGDSTAILLNKANSNVIIGHNSGNLDDLSGNLEDNDNCVYVGASIKSKLNNSANEIIIGFGATGQGSNKATFGNDSIIENFFRGTVRATNNGVDDNGFNLYDKFGDKKATMYYDVSTASGAIELENAAGVFFECNNNTVKVGGALNSIVARADGKVGFGVDSPTANVDVAPSTASASGFRLRKGDAPTSPEDGDMWYEGSEIKIRLGGTTKTFTLT